MKGLMAFANCSGSGPRVVSTCSASCSARTACGPPAAVQPRISERTFLGYCSANSCAIIPPMDTPKMCAVLTRAAFSTAAASAAICVMEYGPGGASLRPTPRLSSAMMRYFSLSTGRERYHACDGHPNPMINNSGAPRPSSSQWILAPKFSTKGMTLQPFAARTRQKRALAREEIGLKPPQRQVSTRSRSLWFCSESNIAPELRSDGESDPHRTLLPFFQNFRQRGHNLEDVADHAIIGNLKNRRVLVLVDSHDGARAFHSHNVLDCPADAQRQVQLRRHGLSRAADLPLHRQPTLIADRARRGDFCAQRLGQRFRVRNIFRRFDPAANRHNQRRLCQIHRGLRFLEQIERLGADLLRLQINGHRIYRRFAGRMRRHQIRAKRPRLK